MSRRGTCVVTAVLLGLAGCAAPEFLKLSFFQSGGSKGNDRVVTGSQETVSQSAESVLLNLGMTVVSTPEFRKRDENEGVRIKATTRQGGTFFLVLTREPGKDGKLQCTRARVEWAGGPEEPVLLQVLAGLEAASLK